MLYYAIGDVHGCADALDRLLVQIQADAAERADGRDWRIVMLGDYVDRGPDSAGVLSRVMELDRRGHIVLPGNHEALMHAALSAQTDAAETPARRWWENGGKQTLKSYGARRLSARKPQRSFDVVPGDHRAFLADILEARAVHHLDRGDGLFFVHAGVRPEEPLAETAREVMLWSRAPAFMDADGPRWVEGLRVVHGHTPTDTVQIHDHRVGLDTGAVYGGVLSCGVFDGGELAAVLETPGARSDA